LADRWSAGAHKLCVIKSNLSDVKQHEFEVHKKRCWQRGKTYYMAKTVVKTIIAPADLKFELWFNGTRYSRNHDPIQVEWDKVGASAKPRENEVQSPNAWERVGHSSH